MDAFLKRPLPVVWDCLWDSVKEKEDEIILWYQLLLVSKMVPFTYLDMS